MNKEPVYKRLPKEDSLELGEKRSYAKDAPNIRFNLYRHSVRDTYELAFATVFGVVLQAGVLVFSAFTTYYPGFNSRFKKGGNPIMSYAYPAMAAGTIILVLGMMLCSYVIGHSTEEKRWMAAKLGHKAEPKSHVLWLQRKRDVSDHSFDSFVLFAKEDCHYILTSRRRPPDATKTLRIQALTVTGAAIGLAGFILQLEGLRGMNWASGVAQLVATIFMTVLRAYVRRKLTTQPIWKSIRNEHEMDWLALRIAADKEFLSVPFESEADGEYLPNPGNGKHDSDNWEIHTGTGILANRGSFVGEPFLSWLVDGRGAANLCQGQKAMKVRQRLGHLTEWPVRASKAAIAVADAIEIVLNSFFPFPEKDLKLVLPSPEEESKLGFIWDMDVRVCGKDGGAGEGKITFIVQKQPNRWVADATEIEAALSLWVFHIRSQESNAEQDRKGRDWLRKGDLGRETRFRQVLGPDTEALRRDLDWWIGPESHTEQQDDTNLLIGFSGLKPNPESSGQSQRQVNSQIVKSGATLERFLAQHVFSAFMWAVADEIPLERILGETTFDSRDAFSINDHTTWNSCRLENATITKLVKDVERTDLGNFSEVSMAIIPPLSCTNKLPNEAMIDLILQKVRAHEIKCHWKEAAQSYLELIHMTLENSTDQFVYKAMATVIEFLQQVDKEAPELTELKTLENALENHPRRKAIDELREIYKKRKEWLEGTAQDPSTLFPSVDHYKIFRYTPLHLEVINECIHGDRGSGGGENIPSLHATGNVINVTYLKEGDILGWTPLHYAVVGSTKKVIETKQLATDAPNYKDISERIPLHYAAMMGKEDVVSLLLRKGAEAEAQGRDGMQPLHWATKLGRYETAKVLLRHSDVDGKNSQRRTALHLAASGGHQNVVKLLLERKERKENIDAEDLAGKTALYLAGENGKADVVQLLINEGADTEKRDAKGKTALHLVMETEHKNVFNALVRKAAVTAKDSDGRTALHLGAKYGRESWVEQILKRVQTDANPEDNGTRKDPVTDQKQEVQPEADDNEKPSPIQKNVSGAVDALVNGKDDSGWTPLAVAAEEGHELVVKLLLEAGAKIEATDNDRVTPLHRAVGKGHEAVIELLAKGRDALEAKTMEGETAIFWAAKQRNARVVRILLDKGADIEATDNQGATLLHRAAGEGNEALVELLVERGAALEAKTKEGETVIFWAAKQGNARIVRILLDKGADIKAKSKVGETALHQAAQNDWEAIVKLLLENGADVNAISEGIARIEHVSGEDFDVRVEDGTTALYWAARKGNEAIVKLLLESRADVNARAEIKRTLQIERLDAYCGDVNIRLECGMTALDWATRNGHETIVRLLQENGGDINAKAEVKWTAVQIERLKVFRGSVITTIEGKGAAVEIGKLQLYEGDIKSVVKGEETALQIQHLETSKSSIITTLEGEGAAVKIEELQIYEGDVKSIVKGEGTVLQIERLEVSRGSVITTIEGKGAAVKIEKLQMHEGDVKSTVKGKGTALQIGQLESSRGSVIMTLDEGAAMGIGTLRADNTIWTIDGEGTELRIGSRWTVATHLKP